MSWKAAVFQFREIMMRKFPHDDTDFVSYSIIDEIQDESLEGFMKACEAVQKILDNRGHDKNRNIALKYIRVAVLRLKGEKELSDVLEKALVF